ncbi:hypothetical protein ACFYQA_31980 [Streptomyces sp. NPDC005774]|uniref:hypothetical protein n=1 Tax=Streptomyces sp. NPDC005774 TaxID=3364728 RepID=UPI0036A90C23
MSDQVDFVTALLKAAFRLSEALYRRTGGNLQAVVFSGVRWGTPGRSYAEGVDIGERAQRVHAGLPWGSVVGLFCKSLVDRAQHDIDRAVADDLNLDPPRDP